MPQKDRFDFLKGRSPAEISELLRRLRELAETEDEAKARQVETWESMSVPQIEGEINKHRNDMPNLKKLMAIRAEKLRDAPPPEPKQIPPPPPRQIPRYRMTAEEAARAAVQAAPKPPPPLQPYGFGYSGRAVSEIDRDLIALRSKPRYQINSGDYDRLVAERKAAVDAGVFVPPPPPAPPPQEGY